MSETTMKTEPFYVCAGICRVNPETNRCIGCGRPWEVPESPSPAAEHVVAASSVADATD